MSLCLFVLFRSLHLSLYSTLHLYSCILFIRFWHLQIYKVKLAEKGCWVGLCIPWEVVSCTGSKGRFGKVADLTLLQGLLCCFHNTVWCSSCVTILSLHRHLEITVLINCTDFFFPKIPSTGLGQVKARASVWVSHLSGMNLTDCIVIWGLPPWALAGLEQRS